jgi:hypothetical protein
MIVRQMAKSRPTPFRLCGEEHAMNILASLGTLNDNLAERAHLAVILN